MERADVVVVGGGPAGSSLAWGLRDSGLRVVLLDRARFPRDKICAGWITPQVLEELSVEPEIYARERVLQPIRGFQVGRVGDRPTRVRYKDPVSYGIRRCELDHFLLERCEAELRPGEPLNGLERSGDDWVVNGSLQAPLVVGAGGHFCPVARRFSKAGAEGDLLIAAQEVEFRLDRDQAAACPVDAEVPEIFFTADLRGYGWIFRKGDWLNVGLGRQDKRQLSAHVARFLAFLAQEGRLPPGLPQDLHGHAYLLHDQAPRPLVADGIALIGDAAGLAYPRSGEGIRPAVESGLLLARALWGTRRNGQLRVPSALERYERELVERLGPRESSGPGLTDLLPSAWSGRLVGRLLGNPWFAKRVVVERWFVHAHQPPLGLETR